MTGKITIAQPGLLTTIQDRGRFGQRHLGIPWSGSLTPVWQQIGNALVDNPQEHCVIECWEGGFSFQTSDTPTRLAVVGAPDLNMTFSSGGNTVAMTPCRSYTLEPDSTVSLRSTGKYRHAIIAIDGLSVSSQLGSASTYAKASLGGLDGSALSQGDQLPLTSLAITGADKTLDYPLATHCDSTELRVVMGPQDDHFSQTGQHNLLSGEYVLGAEADRMGVRLSGPDVEHRDAAARDIVSDAIVPGSIQIPGNGQPIILLNDAHTAGGYPKIATVISIDLPLLGLQRPGASFRFRALSINDAIDATRNHHQDILNILKTLRPLINTTISNKVLFENNLIDGVTDGSWPLEENS